MQNILDCRMGLRTVTQEVKQGTHHVRSVCPEPWIALEPTVDHLGEAAIWRRIGGGLQPLDKLTQTGGVRWKVR